MSISLLKFNYNVFQELKNKITFFTEKIFVNYFVNLKIELSTYRKSKKIVYKIYSSHCEVVSFNEFKPYLKSRSDIEKKSLKICVNEKNEIPKDCCEEGFNFNWDLKKVVYRASWLIPKKIKTYCLKNYNHVNKISSFGFTNHTN